MKRYLFLVLKTVFLLITLTISFELLLMGKVLDFMNRHYRLVTGTDPMGAKQVINAATKALGWVIGKLRGLIAQYVQNFHPEVWHKLRDYLQARR